MRFLSKSYLNSKNFISWHSLNQNFFNNGSTPKRMIFVKIKPALAHTMLGAFGILEPKLIRC